MRQRYLGTMPLSCPYCHKPHVATYKCNARYQAEQHLNVANKLDPIANTVANGDPTYGRYKDKAKRQAYMREYMRKKRKSLT